MDNAQSHPTLKAGQAYLSGVSFYGCFNTGLEPKILKSRLLDEWGNEYKFAVGPDVYVHDAVRDHLLKTPKSNTWTDGRRTVKFFKDARSAWRYFDGLVETIRKSNLKDAENVKRLSQKAKAGDLNAALQLGDYGVC